MKWVLEVDDPNYNELLTWGFDEYPRQKRYGTTVFCYSGNVAGGYTKVFVPVDKVRGWVLSEVEEEE